MALIELSFHWKNVPRNQDRFLRTCVLEGSEDANFGVEETERERETESARDRDRGRNRNRDRDGARESE
jgi:hypothetical protein